ncbi:MAG: transcriptional regulator [Alcanivorax sp.]|nr:transcriptional regulator [Alcanivorax sp.]
MSSHAVIKQMAAALFREAQFISHIDNEQDYAAALALMDELIEDYDAQKPLIDILGAAIERWESSAPEFEQFNAAIADQDPAISTLRLLMEQHHLGVADLPEIGSKSLVSRVLRGERRLTRDHITALCQRFGIRPGLFF